MTNLVVHAEGLLIESQRAFGVVNREGDVGQTVGLDDQNSCTLLIFSHTSKV